jgi:hypothetical protein
MVSTMKKRANPDAVANVPTISPGRSDKVGQYLVRELLKDRMEKNIAKGMTFKDAAESAGIPYEVAIARATTDPEFQRWLAAAPDEGQERIVGGLKTGMQIKGEFMNRLAKAGLFDKIAQMAEDADPATPEGQQMLGFFMRYVVKDILPKESASKVEQTNKVEHSDMTDDQLLLQLDARRAKRLALQQRAKEIGEGGSASGEHGGS